MRIIVVVSLLVASAAAVQGTNGVDISCNVDGKKLK